MRVADGADALEGRGGVSGFDDVASASVLALLPAGLTRVAVLAILSNVVSCTSGIINALLARSTFKRSARRGL